MTVDGRIDLGKARIITMRELNQQTSAVIEEINLKDEPAVVTKHGRFVALITPLGRQRIESVVLAQSDRVQEMLAARTAETRSMPLELAREWLKGG